MCVCRKLHCSCVGSTWYHFVSTETRRPCDHDWSWDGVCSIPSIHRGEGHSSVQRSRFTNYYRLSNTHTHTQEICCFLAVVLSMQTTSFAVSGSPWSAVAGCSSAVPSHETSSTRSMCSTSCWRPARRCGSGWGAETATSSLQGEAACVRT